jgi:hypothetical protein
LLTGISYAQCRWLILETTLAFVLSQAGLLSEARHIPYRVHDKGGASLASLQIAQLKLTPVAILFADAKVSENDCNYRKLPPQASVLSSGADGRIKSGQDVRDA